MLKSNKNFMTKFVARKTISQDWRYTGNLVHCFRFQFQVILRFFKRCLSNLPNLIQVVQGKEGRKFTCQKLLIFLLPFTLLVVRFGYFISLTHLFHSFLFPSFLSCICKLLYTFFLGLPFFPL